MIKDRASGVLLHITSLPGKYGIGSLGNEAYRFVDFLERTGQKYWQILPINPVSEGMGFSPYAAFSAFAGNHYFISFEKLAEKNWLPSNFFDNIPVNEYSSFVDFDFISTLYKKKHLELYNIFIRQAYHEHDAFKLFCSENVWLEDYALFAACADEFKTFCWRDWPEDLAFRKNGALDEWKDKLRESFEMHKLLQFIFYTQWRDLKNYCRDKNISIIGDIPIYASYESCDAWTNTEIFELDNLSLKPTHVAGVPPDYFSETGQRWGNPLYRWFDENGSLNTQTARWWKRRISHLSNFVDLIRIDHFRAFESYWSIEAEEETAVKGKWIKGPGRDFFDYLKSEGCGDNLLAEDLGIITEEVDELRDTLGLHGMKVLQFAFDFDSKNTHLPQNYTTLNCICYTGTHDNNTTNGWFYGDDISGEQRRYILDYLGLDNDSEFHWKLIRHAMMSVAKTVIIPMQDILGYGREFRMNIPGTVGTNWRWKLSKDSVPSHVEEKLLWKVKKYNRLTNNEKNS